MITALCVFLLGIAGVQSYTSDVRLEYDYDFDGAGESYYLKVWYNNDYRYVCWEDNDHGDYYQWEPVASNWCLEYDMAHGSVYTGDDHEGEVEMLLDCDPNTSMHPNECFIMDIQNKSCFGHVRVQCMEPISDFEKNQPYSGALVIVGVVLTLILIATWIGCCCVCAHYKNKYSKGTVHAQQANPTTSAPQQQYQGQQYPGQQYPAQRYPAQQYHNQQPPQGQSQFQPQGHPQGQPPGQPQPQSQPPPQIQFQPQPLAPGKDELYPPVSNSGPPPTAPPSYDATTSQP